MRVDRPCAEQAGEAGGATRWETGTAEGGEGGSWGGNDFYLIVLHHTDCGITCLAGDSDMLTDYFEIPREELEAKAVPDPRAAVVVDVASLRATPALPGEWLVSGLVYDVATGLIDIVVTPAPLRGQ